MQIKSQHWLVLATIGLGISVPGGPGFADQGRAACAGLPSHAALHTALVAAVAVGNAAPNGNGGLGFNVWATLVANDGKPPCKRRSKHDLSGICRVIHGGTVNQGPCLCHSG